jgi:Helix-turn-helix domain
MITLENVPGVVTDIQETVNDIKRLLLEKSNPPPVSSDRWFDLNGLCDYRPDKPAKATVYGEVHRNVIPVHKKGKKLMFLKSEIDAWIKTGRKKTLAEIATEADQYLETKKGRNNGK